MTDPDIEQLIFGPAGDWSEELAGLVATIRPQLEDWYIQGGAQGMERLGLVASFQVTNPEIAAQLDSYTFKFATQIGGTFADDLRAVLKTAADEGWSAAELRKAVLAAGKGDVGLYRAAMIARRESVHAVEAGAHEAFKQQGVTQTVWRAGPSACEFCIALDGKVIGIDETFANVGDVLKVQVNGKPRRMTVGYEDVGYPPLHPFCRCSTDAVEETIQDGTVGAEPKPPTIPPAPEPEPAAAGGWRDAATLKEAERQWKDQFGCSIAYDADPIWGASISKAERLEHLNRIGREYSRLRAQYDMVSDSGSRLHVFHCTDPLRGPESPSVYGRATQGTTTAPRHLACSPDRDRMLKGQADYVRRNGHRHNVIGSADPVESVFRHEIGHILTRHDYVVERWEREVRGTMTDRQIATALSKYATTHSREGICEAFAAMSAPDYVPGTLPAAMERVIMESLLGIE